MSTLNTDEILLKVWVPSGILHRNRIWIWKLVMTRAVSKTAELSGKYLISSDGHILNLERFSQLFRKLEFLCSFLYNHLPPDGSHSEGLPKCGDKDLLQVRRNWTHSQGMSKQGLIEKGETEKHIFIFKISKSENRMVRVLIQLYCFRTLELCCRKSVSALQDLLDVGVHLFQGPVGFHLQSEINLWIQIWAELAAGRGISGGNKSCAGTWRITHRMEFGG